jgi:uncharacterized protein YbjQ (UPF0145 family)
MRFSRAVFCHVAIVLISTLGTSSARAQNSVKGVRFSTTETLQGCSITKYLGVVTAASRIVGDRAPSQKEFPAPYAAAMNALGEQATTLGANWVVKLEFTIVYGYDRDGPATGHFPRQLAAVGTAVQASCP